MKTQILKSSESLDIAGEIIRNGGLVAFPTETVYGLGASAYDSEAAKKIYRAKGRPSDNPLIVHVASKADIYNIADGVGDMAKTIIDNFMPGPITIILKKKECISDDVTGGLKTVAIRYPDHKIAQKLIIAAGVPIAAPSANLSGKPSPTKAEHVIDDMMGRIDAIIDGGDTLVGVESTIVDISDGKCNILRPGGISYEMIKELVPDVTIDKNILSSISKDEAPKCPGMKYKHYAPDAEVYVVEGEKDKVQDRIKSLISENRDKTVGVLFENDAVYDDAVEIYAGDTNKEYAHNLFSALREFDKLKADIVYAEITRDDEHLLAVKNRLYKAAGHKVIYV